MKGVKHSVIGFANGVEVTNIEDTRYGCIFETPKELWAFIDELKNAGGEAFDTTQTECVYQLFSNCHYAKELVRILEAEVRALSTMLDCVLEDADYHRDWISAPMSIQEMEL